MKQNPIDMDPQEIRVELLRNRMTQAEIAESLGVHPTAVNKVIDGLSTSDRIRRAVADAIKTDVRRVWPSIYIVAGGARKPGRPKRRAL